MYDHVRNISSVSDESARFCVTWETVGAPSTPSLRVDESIKSITANRSEEKTQTHVYNHLHNLASRNKM
jgi:hypothetical protein